MAVLLALIVRITGKKVLIVLLQRTAADVEIGHLQIKPLSLRRLVKKGAGVLRKAVSYGQQLHKAFLLYWHSV